jgi:hypothetical protein
VRRAAIPPPLEARLEARYVDGTAASLDAEAGGQQGRRLRTPAGRTAMSRSIRRPSPALIIACLALGLSLSGTGYADIAGLPFNSVGTTQLKTNAVVSSKVKNHSLLAADFKAGQLPGAGYEIVRGRSQATNQVFNSVSVECPPGKNVVGGGGGTSSGVVAGDGPYVVVSQPFDGGGGWLIQTARSTAADSVLLGYAICADVS